MRFIRDKFKIEFKLLNNLLNIKRKRENMYKKYSTVYAGKELELEFGKYAKQANMSVMVRYDGTTILRNYYSIKRA